MGMLNGITADSAAESASFSEETVSENVLLRLLPLIHSLWYTLLILVNTLLTLVLLDDYRYRLYLYLDAYIVRC